MDSTPRDHPLLAPQPRKRSISPQNFIRRYSLGDSIQIKNEIKAQLQPVINQWLATQPDLSDAKRQKISRAIRAAYRQGLTTIPSLKIALPESIHNLLSQQADWLHSPRRGLEEQLESWIEQAYQDNIQRAFRYIAADKIRAAYDNHATDLELKNMQLSSLPSGLGELTSLRLLSLRNNQLRTLPDTLKQLTSLIYIDCSSNVFTEVPEVLEQLHSLRSLLLRDNQLYTLPDTLHQLTSLISIDCSGNSFTELPEVLERLPSLETVIFKNNRSFSSREIEESLKAWVLGITGRERGKRAEASRRIQTAYDNQLDCLDLAGRELSELPEALTHLHLLKKLNISYNSLQQLPDWFNQLENLKTVHIKGNYFIKLPEVLQAMPVTLDIARPGESMTELAERLEFNSLLNDWIEQGGSSGVYSKSRSANILLKAYLQKSTHLVLRNHELPSLPDGIFSKLSQLQKVVLCNNELHALPDDFSQLKLNNLNLSCNQFSEFTRPLRSMTTLKRLDLSHNALKQISAESVVELQQLKYLDLGENKLRKLFSSNSSTPSVGSYCQN